MHTTQHMFTDSLLASPWEYWSHSLEESFHLNYKILSHPKLSSSKATFLMLGIGPKSSHLIGKHSTIELYPQTSFYFLFLTVLLNAQAGVTL